MESVYRYLLALLLPLTLGMPTSAQDTGDVPPLAQSEAIPTEGEPSAATGNAAATAFEATAADSNGIAATALDGAPTDGTTIDKAASEGPSPGDASSAGDSSAGDPEAEFLAGAMGSGLFEESVPQLRRVALVILGGLIVLYFGLAFYRRLGSGRVFGPTPKRRIRVADTVSLGGKRYLCAVEAMGQTLLVGVSGDRIQLLTELHGEPDGASFDETFERTTGGLPTSSDVGPGTIEPTTGDAR